MSCSIRLSLDLACGLCLEKAAWGYEHSCLMKTCLEHEVTHWLSRYLLPLLQALDEDQEGSTTLIKKLFEEDREFNQGTHRAAYRLNNG